MFPHCTRTSQRKMVFTLHFRPSKTGKTRTPCVLQPEDPRVLQPEDPPCPPTRGPPVSSNQRTPRVLQPEDPLCPPTSWLNKLLELIFYKNVFRFNDKFTSKNRAQPWVQRWHLPMPTFSWAHWNPESFLKQPPPPHIGKDI